MTTGRRVWLALAGTLLAGVLLVLPLGFAAMAFLQERLHLYCSYGRMGQDEPRAYTCSDGIGYALPALGLGVTVGLLLLATALATAILFPRPHVAVRVLSAIGIAGLALVVVTSVYAAGQRPGFEGVPADTWSTVMAVPSVLLGGASASLLVATVTRARAARYVAIALVVAATAVEPTILFGTVPSALAIASAILLGRVRQPVAADHSRSSIA
jgi:hypothetical protein